MLCLPLLVRILSFSDREKLFVIGNRIRPVVQVVERSCAQKIGEGCLREKLGANVERHRTELVIFVLRGGKSQIVICLAEVPLQLYSLYQFRLRLGKVFIAEIRVPRR